MGTRTGSRRSAPGWLSLAPVLLAGCYVYTPLNPTAPALGARVALELNDQGRVGVAQSVGPGVARVEGTLVQASDGEYVVQVADVLDLNGSRTRWNGEVVNLSPDYVKTVRERRLSKSRTALLASSVAAALVAFVATRHLFGIGGTSTSTGGGGGETQ